MNFVRLFSLSMFCALAVGVSGCALSDDSWYDDYGDDGYGSYDDDDFDDDYWDDDDGGMFGGGDHNIAFLIGTRNLTEVDDIPSGGGTIDLADQSTFGFIYSQRARRSGPHAFGLEAGLLISESDDSAGGAEVDLSIIEVLVGGRWTYMEYGRFQPYASVGLSYMSTDADVTGGGVTVTIDDDDAGIYAAAGAEYDFGGWTAGVDFRYLTPFDNDLDYTQIAATVGWNF